jgi:hypothetical protein
MHGIRRSPQVCAFCARSVAFVVGKKYRYRTSIFCWLKSVIFLKTIFDIISYIDISKRAFRPVGLVPSADEFMVVARVGVKYIRRIMSGIHIAPS